MKGNG